MTAGLLPKRPPPTGPLCLHPSSLIVGVAVTYNYLCISFFHPQAIAHLHLYIYIIKRRTVSVYPQSIVLDPLSVSVTTKSVVCIVNRNISSRCLLLCRTTLTVELLMYYTIIILPPCMLYNWYFKQRERLLFPLIIGSGVLTRHDHDVKEQRQV